MTKILKKTMLAVLAIAAFLCLSLVFASGFHPASAHAEKASAAGVQPRTAVKNIGSWDGADGLYFLIRDGGEGKLVSDVSYGGLMNVDKNTTIDLNGHAITRTGASGDNNGSVFYVKPEITLIIKDTSSSGAGRITGGNSTYGGGVWIGRGSTLWLQGGNIAGNRAQRGGGVYLESNSTFTMSGGRVQNNSASVNGGGIYSTGSGLTVTISGGEITGNSAATSGGGIYIDNSVLTMRGGSVKNNTASSSGGGIYAAGTFYLRGSAAVTDNKVSGAKNNIYLPSGKKITIDGTFTGSAGIYTQVTPSGAGTRPIVATASSSSYLDASRFSCDKSGCGFTVSGTDLLAVQTAQLSYVLPDGVTWKSGYSAPTSYVVGTGLRLPAASNLHKPADTDETAYELSVWYDNASFTGTRYSQLSGSESRTLTLYAKLIARTKIQLDTSVPQSHTYDGSPHAYELQGANAALSGYTIEYSSDGGNNYSPTAPTDVGSYYVRIQRAADSTYADCYEVISGGVVIGEAAIEKPTLDTSAPYVYTGSPLTAKLLNVTDGVWSVTGNVRTNAGTENIVITLDGNHKWSDGSTEKEYRIAWTIDKASFTPVVAQSGWTYGEERVLPVISGVLGTPAPVYHYGGTSNDGTWKETDSRTAPTLAGNYSLYLTYAENSNTYAATSNTVDFTIARATFVPTIAIAGWIYGGYDAADNAPAVTNNPGGADPVYRYTDKATGGAGYDSSAVPTAAGEYTLHVTIAETAHYKAYAATRDFTVAPAGITVTIADKTGAYGDAQVGLTAEITSGALVGDDANPWSLSCDVTVTTGVGAYDIIGTATDDNYRVIFAGNAATGTAGIYTVTARQITVTIADKTSRYGDVRVGLTASVTSGNLVNDDVDPWSLDCDITATTEEGAYDIAGTPTNENYDVTFAGNAASGTAGVYTVTKAEITGVSAAGYNGTFDARAHDSVASKAQTTVNDQTAAWKYKTTEDGAYAETMPQFTNAGTYTVYYEVTAPHHNAYTGSFEVTIAKKALDKPALADKTYTYDGTEQKAELDGKFDAGLMTPAADTRTKAGTQDVTVTLNDPDNYKWPDSEEASFTIAWTIEKAVYDMSGVTLADKTINENGSAQTIVIGGTLPAGVTVEYTGGDQTEPGVYTVKALFTGDAENYEPIDEKSATLTIRATEIVFEEGEGEHKQQSVVVKIVSGMDPDVKLAITDLQKDESTEVKVNRGKYGRIAQAYDIGFLKGSSAVQPDGAVTVRLLIDESMRSRSDLKVYYIGADGGVTDMNATRDGDYLVFTATHFSTYAIAFTGLFGWEIALLVISGVLFLLLVYVLIFFRLYKKNKLPGRFWDTFYFPLRKLFKDKVVPATAYAGSGAAFQTDKEAAAPPAQTDDAADETATAADDGAEEEADEETEETSDESGDSSFPNIQAAPFTLSFLARLIQGSQENKNYYSAVKNEFLSYGMKSYVRESGEKFKANKKVLGYMTVTGKTLKLYLALDSSDVEKFYGAKKASAKKYEATPCVIRVRNPLSVKKALRLITRAAEKNGLVKNEKYVFHDFAADCPYEPIEALVEKGLAKDNRKGDADVQ